MKTGMDVLAVLASAQPYVDVRAGFEAGKRFGEARAAVVELIAQRDALAASLRRAVEASEARMPNATFLYDARAALARLHGEEVMHPQQQTAVDDETAGRRP